MEQQWLTISENKEIVHGVYRMILTGDTKAVTNCGQFINIALDGFYLRRPISVCDYEKNSVTVIYKVVGGGTDALKAKKHGEKLDVLLGLGNGFDTSLSGQNPVIIGGGVGTPPMYALAKKLKSESKNVTAIVGFNAADEVFLNDELMRVCDRVIVTTVDGSMGIKGFVTDALDFDYSYFFACGPKPMLKALCEKTTVSGQLSLEERMGCGFGACMGCSVMTKNGAKRVCKDGPVFKKEEIIWN